MDMEMDIKRIFSWKDVERIVFANKKKWGCYAERIVVYSDMVEISPKAGINTSALRDVLIQMFDGYYNETEDKITLFFGQSLYVSFEGEEKTKNVNFVPLFRKILYQDSVYSLEFPDDSLGKVPIIAFHSYKGGVGRTLSLLAFAKAWTEEQSMDKRKLLIIDSDIEAPGLTWLQNETQEQHYSYLDLLEAIQGRVVDDSLEGIVNQIKKSTIPVTTKKEIVDQYFMPVYRYEEQLLDIYSKPENIVTVAERQYIISETLSKIGEKLGVSMILVDLRAGISEYSAPFLFDARVKKFLISSTSSQSVDGLMMILRQLMKSISSCEGKLMPEVFLTMVQDTLEKKEKQAIIEKIDYLVNIDDSTDPSTSDSFVTELPFSSELVHLSSLQQIFRVLEPSTFYANIKELVENNFVQQFVGDYTDQNRARVIQNIHAFAKNQVNAEGNTEISILMTQAIANLKKKYENEIPCTLIMGAKGSGKTFLYRQMLKYGTWQDFCVALDKTPRSGQIYFVPVLASKSANKFKSLLETCTLNINNNIPGCHIKKSVWLDNEEQLNHALESRHSLQEWKHTWEQLLIKSIAPQCKSLSELDDILERQEKQIIFLIDGTEEVFQKTNSSETQQIAVTALCQDVVRNIMLRYSNIGVIVFIRKDILRDSIKVNFDQFSQIYSSVELKWSKNEALRLALWLVNQAQEGFYSEEVPIESAMPEVIDKQLQRLWGLKLGKSVSNEAYASRWILAALSDFNGQLQARDIIRFLQYATEKVGTATYKDRYIMPADIKAAIPKCSEKKIAEIKQEIGALSPILQRMENALSEDKKLPFVPQTFNLSSEEEKLMIQEGYLIIDEGKYYLPEILRYSLGFIYKKGARPKVLSLIPKLS